MSITKTLLFISCFSFLSSTSAQSTSNYQQAPNSIKWKNTTHWGSKAYKEISGFQDSYVGYRLNIPHYSQPTNNTCGATSLAMLSSFEVLRITGSLPLEANIIPLYNCVNSDGSSGLSTNELKAAIKRLGVFQGRFTEVGSDNIEDAISAMYLFDTPNIIYGNTRFGPAGGHYYVTTGAIYCDSALKKANKCDYRGLYLNDSVYNSPAFPKPTRPSRNDYRSFFPYLFAVASYAAETAVSVGENALAPNQFQTASELENYWSKTGSSLPWKRSHLYIKFDK